MEIKKLKKPIQKIIEDKTTGTQITLHQHVFLTCYEDGEIDQFSCLYCPYYHRVECEMLPDPRETGNSESSFSDFCDSLHNDHYFRDENIRVTLDMIPIEGSLEKSFAKFPKALRVLKNRSVKSRKRIRI